MAIHKNVNELGIKLCEVLGLDPNNTGALKVEILCKPNEFNTATVTYTRFSGIEDLVEIVAQYKLTETTKD